MWGRVYTTEVNNTDHMSLQQTFVLSMEKVAIKSSADYENAGGFLLPKSVVCCFVGFFSSLILRGLCLFPCCFLLHRSFSVDHPWSSLRKNWMLHHPVQVSVSSFWSELLISRWPPCLHVYWEIQAHLPAWKSDYVPWLCLNYDWEEVQRTVSSHGEEIYAYKLEVATVGSGQVEQGSELSPSLSACCHYFWSCLFKEVIANSSSWQQIDFLVLLTLYFRTFICSWFCVLFKFPDRVCCEF